MKIVLINPSDITFGKTSSTVSEKDPPLGLAYIASALQKAQHEVQIIDGVGSQLSWNDMCETLSKSDPDIIGITTHTRVLRSAFELAIKSKEYYPRVLVVLGGHGTFTIEEQILRRIESVDIIVRGEGEETMVELADALEEGRSIGEILGVCFKRSEGNVVINPPRPFIQNLDLLPFPARHLLPMTSYIRERFSGILGRESFKGTALISSRGCPFSCVFCAATKFYGHRWRPRSAENVIDEIEHLYLSYKKLGLNGFVVADDNFLVDPKRVMKICDFLIDRGLSHLKWMCDARVDSAEEKLYSKMYEAGCRVLAFGIESGNDKVLRLIKKGITTDMVRRAVKIAKSVGLKIWGYFLFGLPGDTDETIMDTIRFSEELDLDNVEIHPVQMYPGTEMGREQNIDWLNFLIEEELHEDVGQQTGFAGFHPCVPTYSDRDRMKTIMTYITRRQNLQRMRKKSITNLVYYGLTRPKKALEYLFNRMRTRDRLPQ